MAFFGIPDARASRKSEFGKVPLRDAAKPLRLDASGAPLHEGRVALEGLWACECTRSCQNPRVYAKLSLDQIPQWKDSFAFFP